VVSDARATRAADGRRVHVRVVERFPRARVHNKVGPLRRVRSSVALLVTAVVLGIILAAALSAVVWGFATAIHHASTS
jgi:hypothetical protein